MRKKLITGSIQKRLLVNLIFVYLILACNQNQKKRELVLDCFIEKQKKDLVLNQNQKQTLIAKEIEFANKERHLVNVIEEYRKNLYQEICSEKPNEILVQDLTRQIADEQYHLQIIYNSRLSEFMKMKAANKN